MRAVYLQSVRSPRQHNTLQRDVARYRQRREVSHWRSVYSQPCDSEDEHDDYLEDSFCVGNNVIEIPGEPVCLHVSLSLSVVLTAIFQASSMLVLWLDPVLPALISG